MALQSLEPSLPQVPSQWAKAVKDNKIENDTIFTIKTTSASHADLAQFLTLRVLWKPARNALELQKAMNSGQLFDKAKVRSAVKFLQNMKSWSQYEKSFSPGGRLRADQPSTILEGTFAIPKLFQDASYSCKGEAGALPKIYNLRTRSRKDSEPRPSTPTRSSRIGGKRAELSSAAAIFDEEYATGDEVDASSATHSSPIMPVLSPFSPVTGNEAKLHEVIEDEQIVNTALVSFLSALTMHQEGLVVDGPSSAPSSALCTTSVQKTRCMRPE